eukprot:632211-Rhodomonas_salina.1
MTIGKIQCVRGTQLDAASIVSDPVCEGWNFGRMRPTRAVLCVILSLSQYAVSVSVIPDAWVASSSSAQLQDRANLHRPATSRNPDASWETFARNPDRNQVTDSVVSIAAMRGGGGESRSPLKQATDAIAARFGRHRRGKKKKTDANLKQRVDALASQLGNVTLSPTKRSQPRASVDDGSPLKDRVDQVASKLRHKGGPLGKILDTPPGEKSQSQGDAAVPRKEDAGLNVQELKEKVSQLGTKVESDEASKAETERQGKEAEEKQNADDKRAKEEGEKKAKETKQAEEKKKAEEKRAEEEGEGSAKEEAEKRKAEEKKANEEGRKQRRRG